MCDKRCHLLAWVVVAGVVLWAVTAAWGASPSETLQKAIYTEETVGNVDEAIKLFLRHRRRGEQPPDEQAEQPTPLRDGTQETRPDLSGLHFRSTLTEEELERDRGRYDSELWKDL